ncbi:Na+/H+ antiporter NhaA [Chloroherpeton thalassium]|nr:Na+/H+ antiporter NhaA [Chloroherpeton thalassium]
MPGKQVEVDDSSYKAPFEDAFRKVMSPVQAFTQNEIAGGLVLMLCLIVALIFANTELHDAYEHFIHTMVGVAIGEEVLEKSIHHWINDGLMTLFFLVVGLEIKREAMVGELSSLSKAALPVIAAFGGMIVPASLYFLVNHEGAMVRGWGIPMATDIAFAVGILALLGRHVPSSVMAFLLALAIADDLGAVLVIGIFYTEHLYLSYLAIAAVFLGVLLLFNVMGVRSLTAYLLVGIFVWAAFLKSGIHATLAGVLVAMTIPVRPKYHPESFSNDMRCLLKRFDSYNKPASEKTSFAWGTFSNSKQAELVEEMDMAATQAASPLRKLEHALHPLAAFVIIPIFALANAGVVIHFEKIGEAVSNPVTIGVMLGLVVGKLIGIAGSTWIAIKLKIGILPRGADFKHIIGVGLMGGIGFTMSIFVTELAFLGSHELLDSAKTGILFASATAGILGYLWMKYMTKPLPISGGENVDGSSEKTEKAYQLAEN